MTKQRRQRVVHFLSPDTLDPLCGGGAAEASAAAVNGVAVCARCARRLTDQVERAPERTRARPRVLR